MLYEISGMKRGFAFALTLISNFNFNRYESGVSGISHNKPQEHDSNFFTNFWQFLQLFYVIYKGQTITERCLKVSRNTSLGCSGESTRLPPMWPGFDSQIRCHMWVEFVGSLLCTERLVFKAG